jgi:NCS1 family nucleobase:cation symporter-1
MQHFGFDLGDEKSGNTLVVMLGAIALDVSYFSGPILNFGDFSRYGKSFAAVKRGNFLGRPVNFIATIGINIVANFISPAFDFSNVSPQRIRWRAGGMIAAVGSVLITPWNLYNNPEVIHTRLLPGQEAAHRHRRSVHHVEGRNLLVQA